MNSSKKYAVVLAAGKGTRMKSPLPKVLHPVAGQPMIQWVLSALAGVGFDEVRMVLGYGEKLIRPLVESQGVMCCRQEQQLGTADAVRSALSEEVDGDVLIMNGDHPLITAEHLKSAMEEFKNNQSDVSVITAEVKKPGKLGRVVRHYEQVQAIVEAKDASPETLKINEVNSGLYIIKSSVLKDFLEQVNNENAQGEYYLTDIISYAVENNLKASAIRLTAEVAFGVNTQQQLALATQARFRAKVNVLMEDGVIVVDPKTTYIEPQVHVGPGSVIYPGAFLKGETTLGAYCVVEPNVFINDAKIGDGVQIRAGSYLESCDVKSKAIIGPYARLRPQANIGESAQIGNFVEIKKSNFGAHSKAGHLAYIGDADVGEHTNIGCGTITCNYAADKKKYRTEIGDHAFIGSDSQFIAPVKVGNHAVIGSGSTITKDVPDHALAVARGRQIIKENYNTEKNTDTKDEK